MRRVLLAISVLVTAAALAPAPATARRAPSGPSCRLFANVPQPDVNAFAGPRLTPWAQIRCAAPVRVTMEICARRITGPGLVVLSAPIWCSRSSMRIGSALRLVRGSSHRCARGDRYVSYATIDGLIWDQSPFWVCGRG
jgi:hypothetical protein